MVCERVWTIWTTTSAPGTAPAAVAKRSVPSGATIIWPASTATPLTVAVTTSPGAKSEPSAITPEAPIVNWRTVAWPTLTVTCEPTGGVTSRPIVPPARLTT